MPIHCRSYGFLEKLFADTHLYSWEESGTEQIKVSDQRTQHNDNTLGDRNSNNLTGWKWNNFNELKERKGRMFQTLFLSLWTN